MVWRDELQALNAMKIVISIIVFEGAALTLLLAYLYYRDGKSKVRVSDRLLALPLSTTANSQLNPVFSLPGSAHCSFISEWQLPEQHDDRRLMNGSVATSRETTSSGSRAFARKSHQLMYKKWSKERHD
jgi:hypothetical protein